MRLAEVYAQSAEHRFGIYCHLLTSLTQLYSAHNTLNLAARDEKVDDAERLREAVVEWTSPAALAAFRAQVPEHQAHIVSHARFEILKVCRKLHSSTRLPDVEAVVRPFLLALALRPARLLPLTDILAALSTGAQHVERHVRPDRVARLCDDE